METYEIDEVPQVGDLVRQRGGTQEMTVENGALGDEHNWEGVRNGVYCTWKAQGEERFEVYSASQLLIVQRARKPSQ